jgi:aryl-alcohol dehydrogenase-like predicted oxidoreductase
MKKSIIAALGALAVGFLMQQGAVAAPLAGAERAEASRSMVEQVRSVRSCHTTRVWRETRHHGRRLVRVRSCHRVHVH